MASLDYAYRRLVNTLGPERVARSEFERMVYSHDFASLPKIALLQWRLYPDFVALPQTTEEVWRRQAERRKPAADHAARRRHRMVRRFGPAPGRHPHRHAEDEPHPQHRLRWADRRGLSRRFVEGGRVLPLGDRLLTAPRPARCHQQ